ncbi:hypothetical protein JAAARDRAFT_192189 [Jaapia argillacea MUCL 33604]|uniref:F-box domain-containing protein n=1 Tax=Jaapia argillacea MUCL 33604 TaxID=933084 RepID=A0A067Q885_9AGAM|nr:hypothetical protein JAAARDRAFT_192189 [Jaapia argillacea MUCL 33604]
MRTGRLYELFDGETHSLKYMQLHRVDLVHWDSPLLANVTTLDIPCGAFYYNLTDAKFRGIFTSGCPSLVNLTLDAIPHQICHSTTRTPVPTLRALTLICRKDFHETFTFPLILSTPFLESLVLEQEYPYLSRTGWREFVSLLEHSSRNSPLYPNLRSLSLQGVDLGRLSGDFSRGCPELTHLSIVPRLVPSFDFISTLLLSCSPTPSSDNYHHATNLPWPALRHLRLEWLDIPVPMLRRILHARTDAGFPIADVFIRACIEVCSDPAMLQ